MYVCLCVSKFTSTPLQSTPYMIHPLNRHDPRSALIYNLFVLILY